MALLLIPGLLLEEIEEIKSKGVEVNENKFNYYQNQQI